MTIADQFEHSTHYAGERHIDMPPDVADKVTSLATLLAMEWDCRPRVMRDYIHELWGSHNFGPTGDLTAASKLARHDMAEFNPAFSQPARARRAVLSRMRRAKIIKGHSPTNLHDHEHEKLLELVRASRLVVGQTMGFVPGFVERYEGTGFVFKATVKNNGDRSAPTQRDHISLTFIRPENPEYGSSLHFTLRPPEVKIVIRDQITTDLVQFDIPNKNSIRHYPGFDDARKVVSDAMLAQGARPDESSVSRKADTVWLMRYGVVVRESVVLEGDRGDFERDLVVLRMGV